MYGGINEINLQACNVRGEGGGLPHLFQKFEKSALILGENALIVVIYGLNFSFKKFLI